MELFTQTHRLAGMQLLCRAILQTADDGKVSHYFFYCQLHCYTVPKTVTNFLGVERVGNFAGYRIRVPGRYYLAGSG